jgi:MFS family permease
MAAGQMSFGPLSDSVGRRPAIIAGFLLFTLGCLLSILSTDFEMMPFGRLLQGVGAAGPRIVADGLPVATVFLLRDFIWQFERVGNGATGAFCRPRIGVGRGNINRGVQPAG